jgi:hypothetical protein
LLTKQITAENDGSAKLWTEQELRFFSMGYLFDVSNRLFSLASL